MVAEQRFRRLKAPELIEDVYLGTQYVDGIVLSQRLRRSPPDVVYTPIDVTSNEAQIVSSEQRALASLDLRTSKSLLDLRPSPSTIGSGCLFTLRRLWTLPGSSEVGLMLSSGTALRPSGVLAGA